MINTEKNCPNKIQTNNNIDQNIQDLSEIILNAADKSIPNKIVTIKSNDSPWITCRIKHLIRNRKRIYRQFKNTHLAHYWTKYKIMRNKVVKEIRKSKQDYLINSIGSCHLTTMIQNYFGKLPNKFSTLTNPPAVYQLLKCIANLLKLIKQKQKC